jgi:tyrosyl-tRNA synthetase
VLSAFENLKNKENEFLQKLKAVKPEQLFTGLNVSGPRWRLIKVDRLLKEAGFVESTSEAARQIKAGAVRINGQRYLDPVLRIDPHYPAFEVTLGKLAKKIELDY